MAVDENQHDATVKLVFVRALCANRGRVTVRTVPVTIGSDCAIQLVRIGIIDPQKRKEFPLSHMG